ncbi:MAG TPA: hypothetical protein VKU19_14925 [Bryobacteraceae bacterium]|nr:hypothetical protein [Bryobacteraceae bacterium]
MNLMTSPTWSTSTHEAGHVIAMLWFGVEFEYVTIKAKTEGLPSLGHVAIRRGWADSVAAPQVAIITAAGSVAAEKWAGSRPGRFREADDADAAILRVRIKTDMNATCQDRFIARAVDGALEFLEIPAIRDAAIMLAVSLEQNTTLSHANAVRIARIVPEVAWRLDAGA